LRIELSAEELNVILQSLQQLTIQGKDAIALAAVITKVKSAFEKEMKKEVK